MTVYCANRNAFIKEQDIVINNLSILNKDVLSLIFFSLNVLDLCNASRACKDWYKCASNRVLWINLLKNANYASDEDLVDISLNVKEVFKKCFFISHTRKTFKHIETLSLSKKSNYSTGLSFNSIKVLKDSIFIGFDECNFKIYDRKTKKIEEICFDLPEDHKHEDITCCEVSKKQIVAGFSQGFLSVYDIEKKALVCRMKEVYTSEVSALSIHEGVCACLYVDFTVKIWNINTGDCLKVLDQSDICDTVLINKKFIITAVYNEKKLSFWYRDRHSEKTTVVVEYLSDPLTLFHNRIACTFKNRIYVYDIETGVTLCSLKCEIDYALIKNIKIFGSFLINSVNIESSLSNSIEIWDLRTKSSLKKLPLYSRLSEIFSFDMEGNKIFIESLNVIEVFELR